MYLFDNGTELVSGDSKLDAYRTEILEELLIADEFTGTKTIEVPIRLDILMVVKDQLEYVQQSIESIRENTESYHLYVWDNGSQQPTRDYLRTVEREMNEAGQSMTLWREETNHGFLKPNNRLAHMGDADYIILLNSDTKVHKGWERALIGFLEKNSEYAATGFMGGLVDKEGKGVRTGVGEEIDFICGWCCCFARGIYDRFGLFDEKNLRFAYCEDADFSFRLKEAGLKIYALHLDLAEHFGNKTAKAVKAEGQDLATTFAHNHNYIQKRWSHYLESERILC
jgi:GT2 family glycosyltransferase